MRFNSNSQTSRMADFLSTNGLSEMPNPKGKNLWKFCQKRRRKSTYHAGPTSISKKKKKKKKYSRTQRKTWEILDKSTIDVISTYTLFYQRVRLYSIELSRDSLLRSALSHAKAPGKAPRLKPIRHFRHFSRTLL